MRLDRFLSYSVDNKNINKFREMKISITDERVDHSEILKELYTSFDIEPLEPLLEKLNKELRSFYHGKYFFDLCLEDKKIPVKDYKRKSDRLTLALFDANDRLSKVKSKVETILKNSIKN